MLDKSEESSDINMLFDRTSMHFIILMRRIDENRRGEKRREKKKKTSEVKRREDKYYLTPATKRLFSFYSVHMTSHDIASS